MRRFADAIHEIADLKREIRSWSFTAFTGNGPGKYLNRRISDHTGRTSDLKHRVKTSDCRAFYRKHRGKYHNRPIWSSEGPDKTSDPPIPSWNHQILDLMDEIQSPELRIQTSAFQIQSSVGLIQSSAFAIKS